MIAFYDKVPWQQDDVLHAEKLLNEALGQTALLGSSSGNSPDDLQSFLPHIKIRLFNEPTLEVKNKLMEVFDADHIMILADNTVILENPKVFLKRYIKSLLNRVKELEEIKK